MSIISGGGAVVGSTGAYQISRSLRFNSAVSDYLDRTPASSGNLNTWTISWWCKRSTLGVNTTMFGTSYTSLSELYIRFGTGDKLEFTQYSGGGGTVIGNLATTQVFRDTSAWYHFVVVFNSGNATSTDRVRLFVNGVRITAFTTESYPSLNANSIWNTSTHTHFIGKYSTAQHFSGYMTEINFIDGQALDPTSFGETDTDTGVWQPKKYTGTYGTNGFYLNFSDNSGITSTTLGKDYSGNGNNWTPNNFSVTAGANNDSLVDTPTPYGTDTGVGGEVRGNYCTLNPLVKSFYAVTPANGNLESNSNASGWTEVHGTIGVQSGKWYWEVKPYDAFNIVGVNSLTYVTGQSDPHTRTGALAWYGSTGAVYVNGSSTATNLGTFNGTNTIGIALNMDAGTVQFYKDGVAAGSAQSLSSSIGSNLAFPCMFTSGTAATYSIWNYGQRPFAHTAPSGFKALCTQNLPEPTIKDGGDYFNTVLWTGDGNNPRTVSGVGFQPDFVWAKLRSAAASHNLYDAVRGVGNVLYSDLTVQEANNNVFGYLSAFNSDGFVASAGSTSNAYFNTLNSTYVAWNWKANGAGSTNTAGTITSTVSVNTTSGFSIVTYTGTGANATVGHGLGIAPSMVIVKERSPGGDPWLVYHSNLTSASYYIELNTTAAQTGPGTAAWNGTAPASTVFSIGVGGAVNGNGSTYVAYCFAPVAGYSAFGSYTGNGSADGPFIYTGFRPRYVLIKRTSATENWHLQDSARDPYNATDKTLYPNLSNAESPTTAHAIDFLANGFKIRNSNTGFNASTSTYIYAAFAENPFKYALAR